MYIYIYINKERAYQGFQLRMVMLKVELLTFSVDLWRGSQMTQIWPTIPLTFWKGPAGLWKSLGCEDWTDNVNQGWRNCFFAAPSNSSARFFFTMCPDSSDGFPPRSPRHAMSWLQTRQFFARATCSWNKTSKPRLAKTGRCLVASSKNYWNSILGFVWK